MTEKKTFVDRIGNCRRLFSVISKNSHERITNTKELETPHRIPGGRSAAGAAYCRVVAPSNPLQLRIVSSNKLGCSRDEDLLVAGSQGLYGGFLLSLGSTERQS
jgi:hypothetical protein